MWPFTLSGRLRIIALVGPLTVLRCLITAYPVLVPVSRDYPGLRGQVAYVLLTRSPLDR